MSGKMMDSDLYSHLLQLREAVVDKHDLCGGIGYLVDDRGEDAPCECMVVFRYLKELTYASIPRDYWQLYWKTLQVKETYRNALKTYFKNFDNAMDKGLGMLFLGTNGIGKTALLSEIGKHAIVKGYSVKYFTGEQYIRAQMEEDSVLLEMISVAKILLLDEVEKAYAKEGSTYVPKKIEGLLREAVSNNKVLIMASNYTDEDLEEAFGESTVSLLKRKLKFLYMTGDDLSLGQQKSWMERLTSEYDYFDRNLVHMARMKRKYDLKYGNA